MEIRCRPFLSKQQSERQYIQRDIDGLGRELLAHVARIQMAEAASNLFRGTVLGQLCGDLLPQPRVEDFPDAS